jgi:hypothetical protein
MSSTSLSAARTKALLEILQSRFNTHMDRHPDISWKAIEERIGPAILSVISQMEESGGEPDLVIIDGKPAYADCSAESPAGRRSLCYDQQALDERKEAKPKSSALQMASEMGIAIMNEDQYGQLQSLGEFDRKTSSWLLTPDPLRAQGGALFGDRRYGRVFTYHNGAQSYYAARGFRGLVWI